MDSIEKTIKESFNLNLLYVEDNDDTRELCIDFFKEFFNNIVGQLMEKMD